MYFMNWIIYNSPDLYQMSPKLLWQNTILVSFSHFYFTNITIIM